MSKAFMGLTLANSCAANFNPHLTPMCIALSDSVATLDANPSASIALLFVVRVATNLPYRS